MGYLLQYLDSRKTLTGYLGKVCFCQFPSVAQTPRNPSKVAISCISLGTFIMCTFMCFYVIHFTSNLSLDPSIRLTYNSGQPDFIKIGYFVEI